MKIKAVYEKDKGLKIVSYFFGDAAEQRARSAMKQGQVVIAIDIIEDGLRSSREIPGYAVASSEKSARRTGGSK